MSLKVQIDGGADVSALPIAFTVEGATPTPNGLCKLIRYSVCSANNVPLDPANYTKLEIINAGKDGSGTDVLAEWTNETGAAHAAALTAFVKHDFILLLPESILGNGIVLKSKISGAGVGFNPLGQFMLSGEFERGI